MESLHDIPPLAQFATRTATASPVCRRPWNSARNARQDIAPATNNPIQQSGHFRVTLLYQEDKSVKNQRRRSGCKLFCQPGSSGEQ
jgi:hypothetical protein